MGSTLLSKLATANLGGLDISDYIVANDTSCPASLVVGGSVTTVTTTVLHTADQASICGCGGCTVKWTAQGAAISQMVTNMQCDSLTSVVAAVVEVKPGLPCSTLLDKLATANLGGLDISDYIIANETS